MGVSATLWVGRRSERLGGFVRWVSIWPGTLCRRFDFVLFNRGGKGICGPEALGGVGQLEFNEFYRSGQAACLRAVVASVGDRQLAEDLVAEAFTRAWMSWAKVSRYPAPCGWVVRTALNIRLSWWRRRRREVALDMDSTRDIADTAAGAEVFDPLLLAALRRLPRRQQEVIVLRVFLDLDTRSTAKVLGIAEGTVAVHLARGLGTLRHGLVVRRVLEVES